MDRTPKINNQTQGAVLSRLSTAPSFNHNPTAEACTNGLWITGDKDGAAVAAAGRRRADRTAGGPGAIAIAAGLLAVGCSLVTRSGPELETRALVTIAGTDQVAARTGGARSDSARTSGFNLEIEQRRSRALANLPFRRRTVELRGQRFTDTDHP